MSTPVVIGFEEDMERTGRDYGREAMLRRLGALAKQRRWRKNGARAIHTRGPRRE